MGHLSDDQPEEAGDKGTEKRLRKLEKTLETRLLDPWERYRALSDLHDAYFEMVEFADRKARFALVAMGALNALNLIVAAQPGMVSEIVAVVRPWLGGYLTGYAILSLYFFVHALQALRPRTSFLPEGSTPPTARRVGLRFIPDILKASPEEYYDRWTGAQVGQLNRELALHVQVLARLSDVKFRALDRVYKGLLALTLLTAAMVTVLAYHGLAR